ncbi:hypothetical protein GCM10025789_09950 [Tessaracoccus lubricantis]|uniref:Uncharacterized protein n=1 Tax=Tessaracoccus lubricantis TaxID=545543 RepID=A0ABP9F641_9ACTN
MQPRPTPTVTQRIIGEVVFLAGLLALVEVLVRGFDVNRLLGLVTACVVGYGLRGLIAVFRRWRRKELPAD